MTKRCCGNLVGVIVWVGAFAEFGKTKIDPYIGLKEGDCLCYPPFQARTSFILRIRDEFDVYRVFIKYNHKNRQLVVIHLHIWPDHKLPEEPALLADLVAQIHGQQLKQAQKGLPTMLVHCSLGVQRSPALLAVYIGRQVWLSNHRVNVHGILQYIRRRRWKAFGFGNPFGQVQVVFGVIQVIAMRSEMEGFGGLTVAPNEREVFDRDVRLADLTKRSKKKKRPKQSCTISEKSQESLKSATLVLSNQSA